MSIASEQFLYYASVRFQKIKETNEINNDAYVLSSHIEQEAVSLLKKLAFDDMPTPQIAFSNEDGFLEIEFLVNNESLTLLFSEDYENPQDSITLYFTVNYVENFRYHYEKVNQIESGVVQECINRLVNMSVNIKHRSPHFTEVISDRV